MLFQIELKLSGNCLNFSQHNRSRPYYIQQEFQSFMDNYITPAIDNEGQHGFAPAAMVIEALRNGILHVGHPALIPKVTIGQITLLRRK